MKVMISQPMNGVPDADLDVKKGNQKNEVSKD